MYWSFPLSCRPLRPYPEVRPADQDAAYGQFEVPERGVRTRAGTIVQLDLDMPAGRRMLSTITGPVGLALPRKVDRALVTEVAALAARVPVGLTLDTMDDLGFLDQLGDVVALDVKRCKDLGPITQLNRLVSIHLEDVAITPSLLTHLSRCPLYQLSFESIVLGLPDTFARLPGVRSLPRLGPLETIARLPGLRSLRLHRLEASSELRHLIGLDRLEHLELQIATCTHADLAQLGQLASLRRLHVIAHAFRPLAAGETSIAAIAPIASTRLEQLELRYDAYDVPASGEGASVNSIAMPALHTLSMRAWPGQLTLLEHLVAPALTKLGVAGGAEHPPLGWLVRFGALEKLALGNKLDDDELVHVRELGALRELFLWRTDVGDAALAHLTALALTDLHLSFTQVGDAGVAHLAAITTLRKLSLACTRVTDAAGPHLAALHALEELELGMTSVGDDALAHIATLSRLRVLDLMRTGVTDAGLPQLTALTQLDDLDLSNASLTDVGMAHLGKLISLRRLSLRDMYDVTGAGVPHLANLVHLRFLNISSSADHDLEEAEDQLQVLLPELSIDA
ncbi:MAG: hypothetical protein H0T89_00155 [Deltaproteobacteria bacterium]|nr:hypothetical protein [Deltaproteobacteria bacterium]MDQ3295325.1 hypothetical protein [Myxococcota bacterium]